jgi:uncharacterized repeat protein (TIGR01451 family)
MTRLNKTILASLLIALASQMPMQAFAQVVTSCPAALENTQLFSFSGTPATFTVPTNVTSVRLIAVGADGGIETTTATTSGGVGAQIEGTFAVTPGQVITVISGQAGASGDLESGGGGASGAYLGTGGTATLALIAGGGGGDDNTGNGGGGTNTNNGSNGGSPAGGDCTAGGLGGTAGNGGQHGELNPTAIQTCQTGDGGSGGGGFLTAGGSSDDFGAVAPAHAGPSGGARCSISGAAGGIGGLRDPTDTNQPGANGGFGICGGGGADHRESGGGGGYSGGGGGAEGQFPGGGGSFVDAAATAATLTAGSTGGGSGRNGSVRVCYTTRADLSITKTDGVATRISGATTTYTINVANAGPTSANGALFSDPLASGLSCTTAALCTATLGAACPGGAVNQANVSVPVASIQAGVAIPIMPSGGNLSFSLTCTVTATGL